NCPAGCRSQGCCM
uniref:Omega-conotoxin Cl16a n=1 Tax=Californiconus californicus TaxID=1736779 RepID=CUG6A_CONCL|nr:RecName: Full=Omega-conotoxin Cl16a; AltName: Full=Conotoxin CalTx; AltName: Full=Omega-conotoxin Cl15a [Californiconus californicus]